MKRKIPSTSRDAHNSIKEHKGVMYDKIKEGLTKLKIGGTFAEVAQSAGLRPEQVWKRLSEMAGEGIIYNTQITRKLPSGRKGFVWQLVGLKSYTEEEVTQHQLENLDKRHKKPTLKKEYQSDSSQQVFF